MVKLRSNEELRWASAVDVKDALEKHLTQRFGSRAEALQAAKEAREKSVAEAKAAKAAKAAQGNASNAAPAVEEADPTAMFKQGFLSQLHAPGENAQGNPKHKQLHLNATGGKVFTRFPPEPNGFLHIGHTKAIAIDFGYAKYHQGSCYLRFDDTNPEAEEQIYFDAILEIVRWLGFEPWKITYSSDYFDQLYALALELIKRGKAYVDHSTGEEIRAERGGEERGPRKESKWRNRPTEESLKEFERMKNGDYKPGEATLRMKQDILGNGNPQMWDLIAYRVLNASHHRTGDKWKIYPTYDFTHCLVDSFENISHSLCTTEFVLSRESYEWLCDAVDVYRPRQYEFGRLSLEGTLTSKRKILKLVKEKIVDGWDDPRLYTLLALRRRGIPPGAILSFINELGVSTSPSSIPLARFENAVRKYLELHTPRLMMILQPLRVVLENVPEGFKVEIERPLHPKVPSMGTSKQFFVKDLWIEKEDFRTVDSKDYFRLAPGKTVGLLGAPFPVTVTSWVDSSGSTEGEPREVRVRYEDPAFGGKGMSKPKTYIQWLGQDEESGSPIKIDEVRIHHRLFHSDNPAGEDNFLDHVNKDSLEVHRAALIESSFWDVARRSFARARSEASARTDQAKTEAAATKEKESKAVEEGVKGAVKTGDGAPERTQEQLIGNECVRFQAMRIAYFALDRADMQPLTESSTPDRIILNRIVSLKEDAGKSTSAK
ncbi:glutaminyl-tRNA synthetase [Ceraceosorus guamensis]|uniref:glutamine--tRNA ligase n=1 Tax=Ceraceosorus guamensis TaxID=1522189 RepID=A0A316VQM9_9BASI|nr:glutaminyl-tRNA synthetase [Ceraceosorus guamensis]PWN38733.1 glutaminyl-tRNA synthetase [Ceraceosorus guamensis]